MSHSCEIHKVIDCLLGYEQLHRIYSEGLAYLNAPSIATRCQSGAYYNYHTLINQPWYFVLLPVLQPRPLQQSASWSRFNIPNRDTSLDCRKKDRCILLQLPSVHDPITRLMLKKLTLLQPPLSTLSTLSTFSTLSTLSTLSTIQS